MTDVSFAIHLIGRRGEMRVSADCDPEQIGDGLAGFRHVLAGLCDGEPPDLLLVDRFLPELEVATLLLAGEPVAGKTLGEKLTAMEARIALLTTSPTTTSPTTTPPTTSTTPTTPTPTTATAASPWAAIQVNPPDAVSPWAPVQVKP